MGRARPLPATPRTGRTGVVEDVATLPHGPQLVIWAAFTALACVGASLGTWTVVNGYSPVPWMDFWDQLPFLSRAVRGDVRFSDLWAQANEHRIVVGRLQFILEYVLFHGTYVFTFAVMTMSCLLIAVILGAIIWGESKEFVLAWGFATTAMVATFSPISVANLTNPIQLVVIQVYLFAVAAIVALVATGLTKPSNASWVSSALVIGAVVAAIAASYSYANGLLVWPVLVVIALVLRLSYRTTIGIAVVGAAVIVSYLWGYQPVRTHSSYTESLRHPLALAKYVLLYLGNPLRAVGVYAAGAVGFVGLALLVVLWLVIVMAPREARPTTLAGAGIALFVLLTAGETALGRLGFGVNQALETRYATSTVVFWLGLFVGLLRPVCDRVRIAVRISTAFRDVSMLAYAAVGMLVALAASVLAKPSLNQVQTIATNGEQAVLAYRSGVMDHDAFRVLHPSPYTVTWGLRWLKRNQLGPWAPGGMVDSSRIVLRPATARSRAACVGHIDAERKVDGGERIDGWIVSPPGAKASKYLAVFDANGRSRGVGKVMFLRPDVKLAGLASSNWTGFVAYSNRPKQHLDIALVSQARDSVLCRLPVAAGA